MKQQQQQRNELISVVTAAILVLPLLTFSLSLQTQRADAQATGGTVSFQGTRDQGTLSINSISNGFIKDAPAAITGENVYVAWWTNNTANNNNEVMFRASTDGGATFADKINLSNTTDADSTRAEIDSDADSVVVTWWETNQTSDTPVMRVSNDNGETFGPVLNLAANGTIGVEGEEEEEGGGEAVEAVEEAVGGPQVAE